ncbi:S-layer homology domain-containing protein [Domibacillus epiphyticus]|uniref:SLH domain-containing protein n=1 Tax=Domibacillus epiphyticus TaxID=1714355 RepID=A0A1V2A6N2_9BACI|nr:S-layer homology domain-containing protein [Domibacillus epiphyticus]OMP66648.1 hypothetical protein BTO28_11435 [Domibacillus epiphyticus]
MKIIRKTLTLMIASFLIMTSEASASFTDVPAPYKAPVDYMVDNGFSGGISSTQFGVQLSIKRVDAAVMLAKALKLNVQTAPESGFTDVPARAQKEVNAMKEAGIISGKTAASFGANQTLTRGEMALILVRAYKLSGTAQHRFTDVPGRYRQAVEALLANEVTYGKTPTSFGTAEAIKRGEFALLLYRIAMAQPGPEDELIPEVIGIN